LKASAFSVEDISTNLINNNAIGQLRPDGLIDMPIESGFFNFNWDALNNPMLVKWLFLFVFFYFGLLVLCLVLFCLKKD
jgi:hypothetical protein